MITNEVLSAYIDGELAPEEMARVRDAVAGDELLAARLRHFRRVDRLLTEFSLGIDAEPLPPAVLALLAPPRVDTDAGASNEVGAAELPFARRPRRWVAGVLALAASLVLAVAIGLQLDARRGVETGFDGLVRTGSVAPSSPLYHALEDVPSDEAYAAASDAGVEITPVLSFVSTQQEYCREFRVDADARAARGVACRRNDRWETLKVVAAEARIGGTAHYATATAETDEDFDTFVDGLVADAPLGADAEARALRNRWKATKPR
jgi:hypothetical protein